MAPDDGMETPLSSDVEEELDGLGLVESLASLAPSAAAAAAASASTAPAADVDGYDNTHDSDQNIAPEREGLSRCTVSLSSRWCDFTRQYRRPILIFALLLLCPVGLYHSLPSFINSADSTFDPPSGTYSGRALQLYRTAYGGIMDCNGKLDNSTLQVFNCDGHVGTSGGGISKDATDHGQAASDPLNPPLIVVMDVLSSAENSTDFRGKPNLVDGWSDLYHRAKDYAMGIEDYLRQQSPLGKTYPVPCQCSCSNGTDCDAHNMTTRWITMQPDLVVTSYYSLVSNGFPTTLAPAAVADDKKTTVVEISFSLPPGVAEMGHLKRLYVEGVMKSLERYGDETASNGTEARGFTVSYTGLRYLQSDLTTSVQSSLHQMDLFILPLALAVLVLVLSWTSGRAGWRSKANNNASGSFGMNLVFVVTIPILVIASSVALWSIIMYSLSQWNVLQVSHFTPTIMMSLTLGMGLDYVMFMMSRALSEDPVKYMSQADEEREESNTARASKAMASNATARIIEKTIQTAGHTVLTSGVTLSVAFLGLVTLPLPMLRSTGFGAAVAILSCVIVNLTIIPALLHTEVVARRLLLPTGADSTCKHQARRHRRGWWRKRRGSDGGGGLQLFGPGGVFDDNGRNGAGLGFVWLSGLSLASDGRSRAGMSEHNDEDHDEDHVGPSELDEGAKGGTGYTSFRDLAQPLLLMEGQDPVWTDTYAQEIMEEVSNTRSQGEHHACSTCVRPSPWRRLALVLLDPYKSLLVLLVVATIVTPVALCCLEIDTSISFELMLPTNSPSIVTSHDLGGKFGPGTLSPYRIIFDGRKADKEIDTEEAFEVMHTVVSSLINYDMNHSNADELLDVTSLDFPSRFHVPVGLEGQYLEGRNRTSYNGIAHVRGFNVPHAVFASAKVCTRSLAECPIENLRALSALDDKLTATDRQTTYMTATLAANPFSGEGISWLLAARDTIQTLENGDKLRNYTVAVQGGAAVEYDVVKEVYRSAPSCIGLALAIIFVLMALFYQSVIAPLRSIICICLTQGFAFGMLVLTYQVGLLDCTGLQHLTGTGELSWLAPVLAFSIIIGLCLDYEIFLIDRVLEFRLEGATHKSSIVAGFHETGPIISAAGLIMAIAFGGLMLSPSPALYQWSFLLTTSVVFDTMIGRMVRVALLGYTGRLSWWPRVLPGETIDLLLSRADGTSGGECKICDGGDGIDDGEDAAVLALRRG